MSDELVRFDAEGILGLSPKTKYMLALSASGHQNKEIAEVLGVSESRVSQVLRDPELVEIKDALASEMAAEYMGEAGIVLQTASLLAAKKLVKLANGAESESVQLRASDSILDRTGFKAKDVVLTGVVHLGREEAELLTETLAQVQQVPKKYLPASVGIVSPDEKLGVHSQ